MSADIAFTCCDGSTESLQYSDRKVGLQEAQGRADICSANQIPAIRGQPRGPVPLRALLILGVRGLGTSWVVYGLSQWGME